MIDSMETAVLKSFEALSGEEFDFLDARRRAVLSRLPLFIDCFRHLRMSERPLSIGFPFEILDPTFPLPANQRHESFLPAPAPGTLNGGELPVDELSVAMVHGSFDPFHLGHLFMGLDAVCDGTCDFALFMPNADRSRGGPTAKPDKSPFGWRTRTVLAGGVDDLFPALRYSSFGLKGGTVESHRRLLEANRPLLERLNRFELWIVIGSDILYRKDFEHWTNTTYRELASQVRLPSMEIRFRIVERPGYPFDPDQVRALDFPWTQVKEVSLASSTAIREDPVGAMWLYPGGVVALESFLLYGRRCVTWASG